MKAIILAAGRSTRLLPLTQHVPKCLLPLGSRTILEHQLELISQNGISKVVIVTGFAAKRVEEVGGRSIHYVHNEDYLTTNSIYSLFLARDQLDSPVLLLNSDILIGTAAMRSLLDEKFDDAVLVDFAKERMDGEMNVRVSRGMVVEISKSIPARRANGECVQLAKFGAKSASLLRDELISLIKAGHADQFPAYAYKPIIEGTGLKAVDVGEEPWIEVDTIDDYKVACNELYPDTEAPRGVHDD